MTVRNDVAAEDAVDTTEDSAEPSAAKEKGRWWHRLVPAGRGGRIVAVAVLVLLLGGAGAGYYGYQSTGLPDGVALRVGDHDVTVEDLAAEGDTLRALYGVTPPTDPATVDKYRRDLAKSWAVSLILAEEAATRGIVIADKTSRDVLTRYVSQQYGDGTVARDRFVQALGAAGTSEAAVLGEIARQLAISQLFDQVTTDVTVTEDDVRAAFAARRDQLGTPERRDISNIVVATREQADVVLRALADGADFATVTRQHSLDASTRDTGGGLGQVAAGELDGGYAEAAFAAPEATVFGPVRTEHGWNIGRVNTIVPGAPGVFDQVSASLRQSLEMEKAMVVWRDWLSTRIRDADVRYADEYRPADPDSAPAGGPGAPQVGPSATPPSK
jgi:peptidyl-prolyl cis-trans isomerase C